jgi:hypothetical protein
VTVVASAPLTAPFFLIDMATLLPGVFILGTSTLGGGDVLGDPQSGSFTLGSSVLGGPDVLGNTTRSDTEQTDFLTEVSVGPDEAYPFPRVLVTNVGVTAAPKTGLLTAISGQAFAFLSGSKVQFDLQTHNGSQFSILATYNGRQNVFVG